MDIFDRMVFGPEKKTKKEVKKPVKKVKNDPKILYNRRVNVAGISNYYDIINEIIESGTKRGIYTKYKGFTLKDFKNTTESIGEIADVETNTIRLEKYIYKGKDAIRVLLEGEHGNFYEIGSIPKKELPALLPYVESKKLKVKGIFVGGTFRKYDKETNEYVDTIYDLGIELSIIVKE